ncbi:MAG: hypothetical protein MRY83_07450 [Flavobacteriales bacterium]|nr:hypothetical protein [Flavobacteriales bacterium]
MIGFYLNHITTFQCMTKNELIDRLKEIKNKTRVFKLNNNYWVTWTSEGYKFMHLEKHDATFQKESLLLEYYRRLLSFDRLL